ncbi:hypothetical protein BH23DEI1_BH23DEI1_14110 [soil metagenome]|nr:GYD domain-containing protein [Trueperaceae bacterium]
MPKFMFTGSYTHDAVAAIRKGGGSPRKAAAQALATSLGGTLECLYFAFGEWDFIAIADLPDTVAAASLASAIGESGSMSRFATTVLLTPADMDAASRTSPTYSPPGT